MSKHDYAKVLWESRVHSAQDAIRRSRYAFLASVVFSVAVIISEYNSQFSWYVHFALNQFFAKESPVTELAQQELIRDWVRSNRVSVSLLGINFGMSDAAFLATTGLYIMSIWFYYSARRENHLIGAILIDAATTEEPELKNFIYHGVASHLVFVTITADDHPIDSMEMGYQSRYRPNPSVRPAFRFLLFLPVVAIGVIVFSDVWSVFATPILRYPHEGMLYTRIAQSYREFGQFILMEIYALMMGLAAFFLCRDISRFQSATGSVLLDFSRLVTPPRTNLGGSGKKP